MTNTPTCELLTPGPFEAGAYQSLRFSYRPAQAVPEGSRVWMFFDIRQDPGVPQHTDPLAPNYVSATSASGKPVACQAYETRTLDLYPRLPEFLHVCEIRCEHDLRPNEEVYISLGTGEIGWQVPFHPIDRFCFWFLESDTSELQFKQTGYKTYRSFNTEQPERLQPRVVEVPTVVRGRWPAPDPVNTRETPGILWGDIHGMAFNQRPLDDYYRYARDVARFDFAAAMLFSYNICVDGVWQQVKEAAARWTEPGRFQAVVGVESGTVPDGSHRNAYFFDPDSVPPIFCEDRPPAREERFARRLNRDTMICDTLEEYYDTVHRFGGVVTGHFHTWRYDREILAEIWQKQLGPEGDEAHIFEQLNSGKRLGIVAGSDTHDSMPGNPKPEPYCLQPAGFMAVLADEISAPAIREAIVQRRVYGTSGARIALRFHVGKAQMGSVLPCGLSRQFQVQIEGSDRLCRVELIRNGDVVFETEPFLRSLQAQFEDTDSDLEQQHWYLVRVTQEDGHRAWSSPIWFSHQ